MDDSVAGCVLFEVAFGEGLFESLFPEGRVNLNGFDGVEDADADGGIGIVETDGKELVVAVEDDSEFAGGAFAMGAGIWC